MIFIMVPRLVCAALLNQNLWSWSLTMWVIKLSTKKCSHNLKAESYFIWWGGLGLWAQETASRYLWENCSKEAGGKSGYIQVCNTGNRQSEHQRSGTKLRNLPFCVWEDASLWAHWIHSFRMHLSYLGTIHLLVHLASCIPPAPQQSPWEEVAARPGLQFGGLLFTFGGQKSLMAVTFFVY